MLLKHLLDPQMREVNSERICHCYWNVAPISPSWYLKTFESNILILEFQMPKENFNSAYVRRSDVCLSTLKNKIVRIRHLDKYRLGLVIDANQSGELFVSFCGPKSPHCQRTHINYISDQLPSQVSQFSKIRLFTYDLGGIPFIFEKAKKRIQSCSIGTIRRRLCE